MSRNGLGPMGLDKLEAALDTYGADRTRWPAPLRLALSGLIAGSADAQNMLKDAEAFDRLLDKAPQYDQSRLDSLSQRIASAAERQPRIVAGGAAIVTQPAKRPTAWPGSRRHGFAATALAASLVLGVFAGQLNVLNASAEVLLGGGSGNASSTRMAQSDEADVLLDEDLL
ncbi:hypothetical protein [Hyphomicrobium sp. ghe19]|uniref:hypothetical protein n=1 Tax=Hyphomicrobium sp. ghe19 TaxID=2682968 RepID=UPI0013669372|nr:hypothetical protein HYPP_02004 [Hyphomicrobium sp. ghe19]